MKGLIVAVAALLMAPSGMAAAQQAAPPLNAEAARSLSDFQNFGPHRAFVIGAGDAGIPARMAIRADHEGAMRTEILESGEAPRGACVQRRSGLLGSRRAQRRHQQRRNRNDQTFHALPLTTEATIRP